MKKISILLLLLIFNFSFSQKRELRKAEKLYEAGDISGAEKILIDFKSIFETADQKVKPSYDFLRAKIARENEKFTKAYDLLISLKDSPSIKDDVENQMNMLSTDVVNSAIDDNEKSDFKNSSRKLYMAYTIDPDANADYLYFAASSAVNNLDYEVALEYYFKLKAIGYTGVVTKYFVTEVDKDTPIEVSFNEYNLYKKSKDYKDFKEEKTESKFPEIVKNIALIYAQQGDNEKAIEAVKEARASNPNDVNLILTEANLYIQLDDKEKFRTLINEAIAYDPENDSLYYNLAVVTADLGDKSAARSYYEKAIEINPSSENSYLNLVALILEGEAVIVDKMNSLGNSKADNAKYDSYKIEREELYKECVPILEKLIKLNKNEDAINTLMNIYGTLGDTDKFKKMKNLLLEG
jgi:tetratricopeptide (TPR) repeat protein